MTTLTQDARDAIEWSGLTVAGYMRGHGYLPGEKWQGDRCGCTDDRCIGYHHDGQDGCGCLPVLIDDVLQARSDVRP